MGLFSGIKKVFSGDILGGLGDAFDFTGSDLLSGGASFLGQADANSANKAMANSQMAFQERMSSTAHQREVKDLIAAGLNPMLSARLGGASSPGGASAVIGSAAGAGANSALASRAQRAQLAKLSSEVENIQADTDQKVANRVNTNLNSHLTEQLTKKAIFDTVTSSNSARAARANADLLELEIPGAQNLADMERSELGKYSPYFTKVGQVAGSVNSARSAMSRPRKFVPLGRHGAFDSSTGEIIGGR